MPKVFDQVEEFFNDKFGEENIQFSRGTGRFYRVERENGGLFIFEEDDKDVNVWFEKDGIKNEVFFYISHVYLGDFSVFNDKISAVRISVSLPNVKGWKKSQFETSRVKDRLQWWVDTIEKIVDKS